MTCPKCNAECPIGGGLDYVVCGNCGVVEVGPRIGAAAAAVLDGDGHADGDLDTILADPAARRALRIDVNGDDDDDGDDGDDGSDDGWDE